MKESNDGNSYEISIPEADLISTNFIYTKLSRSQATLLH